MAADAELHLRTATAPVSARYDWGDGTTRLIVGFESLGPEPNQGRPGARKLPDGEVAENEGLVAGAGRRPEGTARSRLSPGPAAPEKQFRRRV